MEKIFLIGNDLVTLENVLKINGMGYVHSERLLRWIYRKRVSNIDSINDLPKSFLNDIQQIADIGVYRPDEVVQAADGSSKFLFKNEQDQIFESVLMQTDKRTTLCVSTQSGCRMGCRFSMTGSIGFKGNLSSRDILNQLLSIPNSGSVNRIVIMGMGEPLDNYIEVYKSIRILTADWGCAFGKSNITLSSVGILNELELFLKNPPCNLAISLHSPFHEERMGIMPIEKSNPIVEVVELIKKMPLPKPLRVSFEYVALGGVNLSDKHSVAISELLKGIQCHLNIIPWNSHENAKYNTPSDEELQGFISQLNSLGVLTSVRKSMANEIGAACGQMAGRKNVN